MAKKLYSRFSIQEREVLFKYLAQGFKQNTIARLMNRHPSAISREIRRDGMCRNSYSPEQAKEHALKKMAKRRRKAKIQTQNFLKQTIEEKLLKCWSPEQISGYLKSNYPRQVRVSHETIYKYIYSIEDRTHKNLLISKLRQAQPRRRKWRDRRPKKSRIRDLVSISERPRAANSRQEIGHWEGDLVIGKDHKSAIGTLVERTIRFTLIVHFDTLPSSQETILGFAAKLACLPPELKKTLTYDRGSEMARHTKFTELTGIPVYFADAYSPWQRGTNENTNGLIRQYFPKKSDFREVTVFDLIQVEDELNSRPRKCLNYQTPYERLYEACGF